jgi:hypothetical protein
MILQCDGFQRLTLRLEVYCGGSQRRSLSLGVLCNLWCYEVLGLGGVLRVVLGSVGRLSSTSLSLRCFLFLRCYQLLYDRFCGLTSN